VLGKRWNGMIVSTLGGGPSTFVALRRAVAGISDTVLSDRLAELADAGLVARTVDAGPPVTVSYALTSSGEGLLPILDDLGRWASANLAERAH
jgi:DNA-binding HxlR family transcriptional regulator